MRYFKFLFLLLFLAACANSENKTGRRAPNAVDTILKHDTIFYNNGDNWQVGFGLTHNPDRDSIWNKPVSYYLVDKECSALAKAFYYGEFRPGDNRMTADLLDLVTTDNKKLRPFYRWCLSKTIEIQDGALGEYTGMPARQYAQKFPREFFEYMDNDKTGVRYSNWVDAVHYSGLEEGDDYSKPGDIRYRLGQAMKTNCDQCNDEIEKRIAKFVSDCFK